MTSKLGPFALLILIGKCALVMIYCNASRAEEIDYAKIISANETAVVTVKYLLKVSMPGAGEDQESEAEAAGTMIDANGLILCSNTEMGGIIEMMKRMGRGRMPDEMSATPTDLKVLIGNDTEGLEAELVARDTELDLAWVRIKKPGDKKFAFVDFAKSAKPKVGDRVVAVRKMSRYFDRMPLFSESQIVAITVKPRELYVPTGGDAALGMPVFDKDGQTIGVSVIQLPAEDEAAGNPMSNIMTSMRGAPDSLLLLPSAEIVSATKRALENPNADEEAEKVSAKPKKDAPKAEAEDEEEDPKEKKNTDKAKE